MAERKKTDWEAIEREFRANQLSICEIARRHGISDAAIHQKRKRLAKKGIVWTRDLATSVKNKIRDKLVRDGVSKSNVSDDEIVEEAANRGVEVIKLHRKDIISLGELIEQIKSELKDNPTRVHISSYKGEITETILSLTAAEKAMAVNNLANAQHKKIQLERQAFNLNGENPDEAPIESIPYCLVDPPDRSEDDE